jgi:hypothetical protein
MCWCCCCRGRMTISWLVFDFVVFVFDDFQTHCVAAAVGVAANACTGSGAASKAGGLLES